jgi:hypothetical protein
VTWRLSAEQAERLSPGGAAQLLLALAALLGGDAIPGTLFTAAAACDYLAAAGASAVADPEHAWDAVLALERTGLLAINTASAPPLVWMSPAIAAQVQAATPPELSGQAVTAAADALVEIWPAVALQPWTVASLRSCAASLHQAVGYRLWAIGGPHPVLLRAGHSMDRARLTGPAATYWTELVTTSEKIEGPDDPATLTLASHLVRALLAAGQAAEAAKWSQRLLVGQLRTLGPNHPGTLTARVTHGRALVAADQARHARHCLGRGGFGL